MQSHRLLLPNSFIRDPVSPNKCISGKIHKFPSLITCSSEGRKTLERLALSVAYNLLPGALSYVMRERREPLNYSMGELGGGDAGVGSGGSFGSDGGDDSGRKKRVNELLGFGLWYKGFMAANCLAFAFLFLGGDVELYKQVLSGMMLSSMFLVFVSSGGVPVCWLAFIHAVLVLLTGVYKIREWEMPTPK